MERNHSLINYIQQLLSKQDTEAAYKAEKIIESGSRLL